MWYAIISEDHDDSLALRMKSRPAHLERLTELVKQGRLLAAGPHPKIDADDPGSAGIAPSPALNPHQYRTPVPGSA